MQRATKSLEPVIKWSGSKRKIAPILSYLLPDANEYFEPFVGSGAMLPFRPSSFGKAGDAIPELIKLWEVIRDDPERTANEYNLRWKRLRDEGYLVFYEIRDLFNKSRSPHDFLFLSRTCVNGLIRFNKNGDFNNSLHHTRPGIDPERLARLIHQWSYYIQNITFIAGDYRQTLEDAKFGDLAFLDPPYNGTKGRYAPTDFDFQAFFVELERLNKIGVKWILTLDGVAGERAYHISIPSHLYKVQFGLPTGNSPFTKLMKTSIDPVVESVYLNFEPPPKSLHQVMNFGQKKLSSGPDGNMTQSRLFI
jgi:DNA adenine methylase